MYDHTNPESRLREPIRDVPSTTGGSTAFILGALAVAVLVIVWAVLSGVDAPTPTSTAPGDTDITIEAPAAPDAAAPVETAPAAPDAAAPDAAAPVETAPAAPDDGATAPAAPPADN
jgi:hypothetical protein